MDVLLTTVFVYNLYFTSEVGEYTWIWGYLINYIIYILYFTNMSLRVYASIKVYICPSLSDSSRIMYISCRVGRTLVRQPQHGSNSGSGDFRCAVWLVSNRLHLNCDVMDMCGTIRRYLFVEVS